MAKNLLKIENVYFAFTNIDKPLKDRFDTSGLTQKFNSTIILSKDQAKEFKRQKLNKTVKEVETSEFESKYKFAPPYPEQDEQYYIQVSNKATYADGNLKPEFTYPKAFFQTEDGIIEDSKVLIGNGSFGHVRLDMRFNDKLNTTSITLDSVLITKHVPYEKSSGDEWAAMATNKKTESVNANSKNIQQDLDDDLPF